MQTYVRGAPRAHPFDDLDLTGVPEQWHTRVIKVRHSVEDGPWTGALDAAALLAQAHALRDALDVAELRDGVQALERVARDILRVAGQRMTGRDDDL